MAAGAPNESPASDAVSPASAVSALAQSSSERFGAGSRSRSTGGAPPPWAVGGSARGGALHPDLRFRLRELGIAISSDLFRAPPVRGPPPMLTGPAEDKGSRSNGEAVGDGSRPAAAVSSEASPAASRDPSSPARGSCSPARGSCSPSHGSCSPGSDKGRLSKPDKSRNAGSGDASGPFDPGVDDLLLQLDDLDARNRVLQQDAASRTLQHKCAKETMASTAAAAAFKAAASSAKASSSPTAARSTAEKTVQSEEAAAAQSVVRQHPLAGLQLYGSCGPDGAQAIEQLRWRRRRDRPPKAPLSAVAPDPALSPPAGARGGSSPAARHCGGEAAWQSHRKGKQAVGGSVALPPLKSSASAPGFLAAASWTNS